MEIEFEAAAHIDDQLEVITQVVEVSGARLSLRQEIAREGQVITRATVLVVAIRAGGGPVRLPKQLLARLLQ
jgi:acyl-CoA thioester hydrolase